MALGLRPVAGPQRPLKHETEWGWGRTSAVLGLSAVMVVGAAWGLWEIVGRVIR